MEGFRLLPTRSDPYLRRQLSCVVRIFLPLFPLVSHVSSHVVSAASRGQRCITWSALHHVVSAASRGQCCITWSALHHVVSAASCGQCCITWSALHHVVSAASRGQRCITWSALRHITTQVCTNAAPSRHDVQMRVFIVFQRSSTLDTPALHPLLVSALMCVCACVCVCVYAHVCVVYHTMSEVCLLARACVVSVLLLLDTCVCVCWCVRACSRSVSACRY